MTQIKIWIPHSSNNYENVRDLIAHRLSSDYGGSTLYQATGQWVNDDKELIEEPVVVIESFTGDRRSQVLADIEALCKVMRNITGEDAIMFSIDNDHMMVRES